MLDAEVYQFDCPECDHTKHHRTALGGAIHVFRHFFVSHGWYSFKVGFPLFDETPPEFDKGGSKDER